MKRGRDTVICKSKKEVRGPKFHREMQLRQLGFAQVEVVGGMSVRKGHLKLKE